MRGALAGVLTLVAAAGLYAATANQYFDEGVSNFKEERYYKAIDSLKNALEANPYYGDAYRQLGEVYYAIADYGRALQNGLMALKYSHNDVSAMLLTANSYRELGRYDLAEQYYKKIQAQFPANGEVYRNMGVLYIKMNKLSQALEMLGKALRLSPNSWLVYSSLGDYYYRIGNMTSAEKNYQQAFKLESRNRSAYYMLASFYYNTGRYADAVSLLRQGETLFNNFVSGVLLLGDSYFKQGDYANAFKKYSWIETADFMKSADYLGWLYYKMALCTETQDPAKATLYYKKALLSLPDNQLFEYSYESFIVNRTQVTDPQRAELSKRYLDLATADYSRGAMRNYVMHLKRALFLNPFNAAARDKLIAYYETKRDYYRAYNELKALFRVDGSYAIRDKIQSYDYRVANRQIVLENCRLLQFKGLFVSDEPYFNFSKVFTDMVLYYSGYFDKFKLSTLNYRKSEGMNSILEYVRSNGYQFFIVAELVGGGNSLKYSLYDSGGELVDSKTINFTLTGIEECIMRLYAWLDDLLPEIAYVQQRQTQNSFSITMGSAQNVKVGEEMMVVDLSGGQLRNISLLRTTAVSSASSTCSVVSNVVSLWDGLVNKAVIRNDYLLKKDLTKLKRILPY